MSDDRFGFLVIDTGEGVHFRLRLAGPFVRLLAWGIDGLCVLAGSSLLNRVITPLAALDPDLATALYVLSFFLLFMGYSIALEWKLGGQTVGKRLLRLRVTDADGLQLKPWQVVVRNLLRTVDFLPLLYAIGGTACFLSRRAQRLGDLAANTIVIHTQKLGLPPLDALRKSPYNSFREHPRLLARVRQALGPEESRLLLDAVLRRDSLDVTARVALFAELAAHLKTRVNIPVESLLGLSDERIVSNVVEGLFVQATPSTKT